MGRAKGSWKGYGEWVRVVGEGLRVVGWVRDSGGMDNGSGKG